MDPFCLRVDEQDEAKKGKKAEKDGHWAVGSVQLLKDCERLLGRGLKSDRTT